MKLLALSISRWKHSDASIKEPVHLSYAVELSQFSFFQRGTVKEITALVLRTCVSKTNPGDYQVWQAAAPCCWRGRTRWSLPGAWTGAWSRAPSRRQGGAVAAILCNNGERGQTRWKQHVPVRGPVFPGRAPARRGSSTAGLGMIRPRVPG